MASAVPQLLVSVKSPVAAMELIASEAFPELLSVNGCCALAVSLRDRAKINAGTGKRCRGRYGVDGEALKRGGASRRALG